MEKGKEEWFFTVGAADGWGNPCPYKRTTQRGKKLDKDYRRYLNWKTHARSCFIDMFEEPPENIFDNETKYFLEITIYFKNEHRADCTNVLKGLEDAIFADPLNDKNVVGRTKDFFFDKKNPRVEVRIWSKK